jgi:hypothetical protein
VLLAVVALLILLFIGGQIWWFFLRDTGESGRPNPDEIIPPVSEAPPTEPTPPPTTGPVITNPLLAFDQTEFITLDSDAASAIAAALDQAVAAPRAGEADLVRLVFVISSAQGDTQLPFETMRVALGLAIPQEVLAQLGSEYDLFVLPRNVFDEETCRERGARDADCAGARLGLAVRTKDSATLASSLRTWEATMVGDLRRLIAATIEGAHTPFLTGTYRTASIRYRNLPLPTTTIDYALSGNILLITTSKSSMYAALDRTE